MKVPALFRQHPILWMTVLLYLSFIFLSLPYLPLFVDRFVDYMGGKRFGIAVNIGLALGCLIAIVLLLRLPWQKMVLATLPMLATLGLAVSIRNPTERLHVIGYLVLGGLLYLASDKPQSKKHLFFLALATAFTGLTDEAIQGLLPHRYWDIKDVGVDAVGGGLGVWLSYFLLPHSPVPSSDHHSDNSCGEKGPPCD
ncbi:MAG: VanZ family protein [Magnetococcales bacterium]|nr:VanZ family protein [Magnetococcales bacterium]NGZ26301.1 VanZ family protein [Magnetococcales bacterium]